MTEVEGYEESWRFVDAAASERDGLAFVVDDAAETACFFVDAGEDAASGYGFDFGDLGEDVPVYVWSEGRSYSLAYVGGFLNEVGQDFVAIFANEGSFAFPEVLYLA